MLCTLDIHIIITEKLLQHVVSFPVFFLSCTFIKMDGKHFSMAHISYYDSLAVVYGYYLQKKL